MTFGAWRYLAVVAAGLAWGLAVPAAPKPKDPAPTKADLEAFATKVTAALIKKDADGFLRLCEVPFHQPGGYRSEDKDALRRWITKAMNNGAYREGVDEVKWVETFEAAKARFTPAEVRRISQVLADTDCVISVEMEQVGIRKYEEALLIKVKGGKPRLVGLEVIR